MVVSRIVWIFTAHDKLGQCAEGGEGSDEKSETMWETIRKGDEN